MLFSKIIEKKFDAVLGRYDGDCAIQYHSVTDFPNLKSESYDLKGDKGITLKGWFYYYNELDPQNLILFDHGIGAGHLAYLKEIEYLAHNGYTVYSYDHTGCVSTDGTGIYGFAQGINDLDHVLNGLNNDPRFQNFPRKIMGHSWGAYSCMNVSALHPEVSHIVSLAGFLSARSLIEQYIPKPFLKYSNEVMDRERRHNPKYADLDARDSLEKSKAKLLHIQSRDDKKVELERSYLLLSQALEGRENTDFMIVEERNHDPQRTKKSATANLYMQKELNQAKKKKKLSTKEQQEAFKKLFDWNVIYEQDDKIWNKILSFLK